MIDETEDPIKNRNQIGGSLGKDIALDCVAAGILAADPAIGVRKALSLDGTVLTVDSDEYDLSTYDRVLILGGGNAAGHASVALEDFLGPWIDDGVIITDNPVETEHIRMAAGDHPIPSDRGIQNSREILSIADSVTADDLIITLITGGGSALLASPGEISLETLQETTDALLGSGATIHEINAVRKRLSEIKGGELARRLSPATTIGLLCSDVVGEDPSVIASGPLTPDTSTYAEAAAVLETYDLDVPDEVANLLADGVAGDRDESPAADADVFERVHTYVIASNGTATQAAAETARAAGFTSYVLGSRIRGRAREVAKVLIGIAEEIRATGTPIEPPVVLVSGGETTVEISGKGTGGPNQELAVSGALELNDDGVVLTAIDTDGIDGNSEAAGGIVTSDTAEDRAVARGALKSNNTAHYLNDVGGSIRTGPTSTNVNDLHVIVIKDSQ